MTGKAYSAQNCTNGLLRSSSAVVSYTYDVGTNGIGHMTSLTDQAGSGTYGYDALGRILTESRTIAGITKNMSYSYYLDSSINTLTYPSGAVITYTPWNNGTNAVAGAAQSAQDINNGINYAQSANYQADGQLTALTLGNGASFSGIAESFQYNTRLQICRITALTTGSMPGSCTDINHTGNVIDLGYNLNLAAGDNGNVLGVTNYKDSTRSQTFTYDTLNRLTSAQNAGTNCSSNAPKYWGNSYVYDPWGNLLQKNVTNCSAENLQVTVNTNNQFQGGYTYDAAGNMLHDATVNLNYIYDAENRINSAGGYTYTYDDEGNRVEKSNGSTGMLYWYMSPGIVAETNLSGNPTSEYIFFAGARAARKDFPGGAASYYFSDRLRTTTVITDSGGNITADSDYYPWGGELAVVANNSNHYKFTGKERDSETGLDYFGARYYGNGFGRFLTADTGPFQWKEPQSLNRYVYALNNPLRYIDPDGQAPLDSQLLNQITEFAHARDDLMQKMVDDYRRDNTLPEGASQALQNDIRSAAVHANADIFTGASYPTSIGFYDFEIEASRYLAGDVTSKVIAWVNDPTTTKADLEAALTSLEGALHAGDLPGFVTWWLPEGTDTAGWLAHKTHLGGNFIGVMRSFLIENLRKVIADAKKKKEEEEKKREEDRKKKKKS